VVLFFGLRGILFLFCRAKLDLEASRDLRYDGARVNTFPADIAGQVYIQHKRLERGFRLGVCGLWLFHLTPSTAHQQGSG